MFEHIRKHLPWRIREERMRKEKFIKKLQDPGHGQPKIRFKDAVKIPSGAMIMLQDYRDNSIMTAIYSGQTWMTYETYGKPTALSIIEFEDLLTEKRTKATATDKFLIHDANQLLNIDYSAHNSISGFNKIQWINVGNEADQ